jgi:SAM-dependent methyltransferase
LRQHRYNKYRTKNSLVLWLIKNFYSKIAQILQNLEYQNLLDAGCGDGEALARLAHLLPDNILGVDNDEEQIDSARRRFPTIKFEIQDIYHLPYENNSFDLVLSLEILEHLSHPSEALAELARVSSKYLVLSVPHEPFFMLGNLMRGKNLSRLGNDLGHINHWGKRSFFKFLAPKVEVELLTNSFPWLIAFASK